jgi:hypothetical protein
MAFGTDLSSALDDRRDQALAVLVHPALGVPHPVGGAGEEQRVNDFAVVIAIAREPGGFQVGPADLNSGVIVTILAVGGFGILHGFCPLAV